MSELTKEMPKKLGFGCMRLPVADGSTENINDAAFCEMIDSYLEQGFKYFDTAYPYHNGRSEEAVGRCLVQRYARDRFFLASKMPVWLVKEYADYGKYFEDSDAVYKRPDGAINMVGYLAEYIAVDQSPRHRCDRMHCRLSRQR